VQGRYQTYNWFGLAISLAYPSEDEGRILLFKLFLPAIKAPREGGRGQHPVFRVLRRWSVPFTDLHVVGPLAELRIVVILIQDPDCNAGGRTQPLSRRSLQMEGKRHQESIHH
jgi:hypothetical protein